MVMEGLLLEPTLYTVKGMAILDNDGNRILAKYYDKNVFPTAKEQKTFEKNLFNKTHRANAEIIMLDGLTCVYRSNVDLFFYVMGSSHENELILMSVLNCLYDSVSHILRKNVEKRVVLENLDIVMLAMDEICDGGIIMEADSSAVVQRVALRTDDIPLGEQTVAQGWDGLSHWIQGCLRVWGQGGASSSEVSCLRISAKSHVRCSHWMAMEVNCVGSEEWLEAWRDRVY
uniref:Coatomer subunit zeta n=1 Tax=Timema californicum TaxID=61474 RepID=A0A7R9IXH4_TIMCA|nr:unnamed protein product [Timema californicum]